MSTDHGSQLRSRDRGGYHATLHRDGLSRWPGRCAAGVPRSVSTSVGMRKCTRRASCPRTGCAAGRTAMPQLIKMRNVFGWRPKTQLTRQRSEER